MGSIILLAILLGLLPLNIYYLITGIHTGDDFKLMFGLIGTIFSLFGVWGNLYYA